MLGMFLPAVKMASEVPQACSMLISGPASMKLLW